MWPSPALTPKETAKLKKIVEAEPAAAAKVLDCSPGQAAAYQRYIVLVCVTKVRERREIPCTHEHIQAKALMRCLPPGVRLQMPEALRFAFTETAARAARAS